MPLPGAAQNAILSLSAVAIGSSVVMVWLVMVGMFVRIESNMTEVTSAAAAARSGSLRMQPSIWGPNLHKHLSEISCLENPRDGGAWWAAVHGVAESRTRLK